MGGGSGLIVFCAGVGMILAVACVKPTPVFLPLTGRRALVDAPRDAGRDVFPASPHIMPDLVASQCVVGLAGEDAHDFAQIDPSTKKEG